MTNFKSKLAMCAGNQNSLLCVGLDPDVSRLPDAVAGSDEPLFDFNRAIIDATHDLVCAYKPNSAFYEASGDHGIAQLAKTCDYLHEKYPHIPILLDFKRGDIGNTNNQYAQFAFDYLGVDAVTINPYLGREAVEPFLEYAEKGIFVLCRTSNPGSGEFQDINCDGKRLYQIVAEHVTTEWNAYGNCMLVVGATFPGELAVIRQSVGNDVVFLIPGIGSQGGNVAETISAALNGKGNGILVNASREVLYASSHAKFAQAAREKAIALRDEINSYRGQYRG